MQKPGSNQILQVSDIHIGACRSLSGYLTRHREVLQQIVDISEQRLSSGGVLTIPGDLFDAKNTTYDERMLASWFLGELERRQIRTIVTAGNHDHLYGQVTQLDDYRFMPLKWVTVVGWVPEVHIVEDTGFICLSWGNYAVEHIKTIVQGMLPSIAHCKYKVVMAHECVVGSTVDNGEVMTHGSGLPEIPEVTYWAIGDIHIHQRVLPNGYYAGAPVQIKFDDVQRKGMIAVDLDNPTAQPQFLPIRSKPMKIVDSAEGLGSDAYYMVRGGLDEVVKAHFNENVVKTDWVRTEKVAVDYDRVGMTHGLAEHLASKGFDEDYQKRGIAWVESQLQGVGGGV